MSEHQQDSSSSSPAITSNGGGDPALIITHGSSHHHHHHHPQHQPQSEPPLLPYQPHQPQPQTTTTRRTTTTTTQQHPYQTHHQQQQPYHTYMGASQEDVIHPATATSTSGLVSGFHGSPQSHAYNAYFHHQHLPPPPPPTAAATAAPPPLHHHISPMQPIYQQPQQQSATATMPASSAAYQPPPTNSAHSTNTSTGTTAPTSAATISINPPTSASTPNSSSNPTASSTPTATPLPTGVHPTLHAIHASLAPTSKIRMSKLYEEMRAQRITSEEFLNGAKEILGEAQFQTIACASQPAPALPTQPQHQPRVRHPIPIPQNTQVGRPERDPTKTLQEARDRLGMGGYVRNANPSLGPFPAHNGLSMFPNSMGAQYGRSAGAAMGQSYPASTFGGSPGFAAMNGANQYQQQQQQQQQHGHSPQLPMRQFQPQGVGHSPYSQSSLPAATLSQRSQRQLTPSGSKPPGSSQSSQQDDFMGVDSEGYQDSAQYIGGVDLNQEAENIEKSTTHLRQQARASSGLESQTQVVDREKVLRWRSMMAQSVLSIPALGRRMGIIAKPYGVSKATEDACCYLALALEERLRDILHAAAEMARHRTNRGLYYQLAFQNRVIIEEARRRGATPQSSRGGASTFPKLLKHRLAITEDPKKQLVILERYYRQLESRLRAQMGIQLECLSPGVEEVSEEQKQMEAKKQEEKKKATKKEPRKPTVTAEYRRMSEDVRKRMSNRTALIRAGMGGFAKSWMTASEMPVMTPEDKALGKDRKRQAGADGEGGGTRAQGGKRIKLGGDTAASSFAGDVNGSAQGSGGESRSSSPAGAERASAPSAERSIVSAILESASGYEKPPHRKTPDDGDDDSPPAIPPEHLLRCFPHIRGETLIITVQDIVFPLQRDWAGGGVRTLRSVRRGAVWDELGLAKVIGELGPGGGGGGGTGCVGRK